MIIGLILQLAVALPVPAAIDSIALVERVKDARFQFIMSWRYQVQWDRFEPMLAMQKGTTSDRHVEVATTGPDTVRPTSVPAGAPPFLKKAPRDCDYYEWVAFDIDQHDAQAHLVKKFGNYNFVVCAYPSRRPPPELVPGADRTLSVEARDTIRVARAGLLRLLDSAARVLPGDRWIAGQRVRFALDQADVPVASRAIAECRAEPWWCGALQGYLLNAIGDRQGATRAFTTAYAKMPPPVRAEWDDASFLMLYEGKTAYAKLTGAARDSANAMLWWLADPLFLEDGNDRHVEQLLRRTTLAIWDGEVDLWTDWRPAYHGPVLGETLLRYGWPLTVPTCQSGMARGSPDDPAQVSGVQQRAGSSLNVVGRRSAQPIPFRRGDTRAVFLGCPSRVAAGEPPPIWATYAGPMFHVVPHWRAVGDPFHLTPADWDLAPPRDVGTYWDESWWAPELYQRPGGAIVPVDYQIALLRRQANPVLAAAMAWDTAGFTFSPPATVTAAAITMAGPTAPRIGARDTMTSADLHGMAAAIPPGPTVLSLEMMPRDGTGTSGRARFGITAPPSLAALRPGEIAVSDPILVRAPGTSDIPRTLQETLPRMFGTTRLTAPTRVGLFWEVYGLTDHDTVNVSVKIAGKGQRGIVSGSGALLGIGRVGGDSIVIRWTEPRPDDPAAMVDGGTTIRPRGLTLNLSQLGTDTYSVEISIERGSATARSTRQFEIRR